MPTVLCDTMHLGNDEVDVYSMKDAMTTHFENVFIQRSTWIPSSSLHLCTSPFLQLSFESKGASQKVLMEEQRCVRTGDNSLCRCVDWDSLGQKLGLICTEKRKNG